MADLSTLSPDLRRKLLSKIAPGTGALLRRYTSENSLTLEIGCGPGQYRFAVKGKYIGIDLTYAPYSTDLPRVIDAVADANHLPFKANTYDLVFYSNTFHYFPNATQLLGDTLHVLKHPGILLIFDYTKPILQNLQRKYMSSSPGWTAHVRTCKDWIILLEKVGLEETNIKLNDSGWKQKIINNWLPKQVRFSITDLCESSIVVIGTK